MAPLENDREKEKMVNQIIDFRCFMAETLEWRKDQRKYTEEIIKDIKDIRNFLSKLPCDSRRGWYDSMGKQVSFMWLVLAMLLTATLGIGWKGIVERQEIMKDVRNIILEVKK